MNKPEEIANRARDSLGEFCMNECNAYCCRKGYLILSEEELKLFEKDNIKTIDNKKYSLFLGNPNGCPNLDGVKCKIHRDPNRPSACKEFPIFIEGNKVRISKRCFGAKEGKLYPFIREFLMAGCEII